MTLEDPPVRRVDPGRPQRRAVSRVLLLCVWLFILALLALGIVLEGLGGLWLWEHA